MTVPMLEGLTIILPLKFGEPYSSDVRWPVISFSGHLFFYPKKDPRPFSVTYSKILHKTSGSIPGW